MNNSLPSPLPTATVCWILFDYGGVLADEGFHDALAALSKHYELPPEELPQLAMDAIYDSGYVTGHAVEAEFWDLLHERFPFIEPQAGIREEILHRFRLRRPVLALVDRLRELGFKTAILSDQADWLDQLDRRDQIYAHFDRIFNSFTLGKGKRDPTLFDEVTAALTIPPSQAIFIDDNPENVRRAVSCGLHGVHYQNIAELLQSLASILGIPAIALAQES